MRRTFRAFWIGAGTGLLTVALATSAIRRWKELHQPFTRLEPAGELTCAEVQRIGTWSEERYGGRSGHRLRGTGFPGDVAKEIAKRLDPEKLLLLQSEVDSFAAQAKAPWDRFLKNRDCGYFDHWIHEQRLRSHEAFRARLAAVLATLPETAPKAGQSEDAAYETYSHYGKDEKALAGRLAAYARKVSADASAPLLAAYGGNRRSLVAAVVEQGLFPEGVLPRVLFAKGLLGALDPYSTYFSADEFDDFYQDLSGGVSGIGVRVRRVPRGYLVESLIQDSPAAKAGDIEVGDIVVAIDGSRLSELEDRAAKKLFKGAADSVVRLTLEKPKSGATQVLSLVRRHFDFQESRVTSRVIFRDGEKKLGVGVIEVPSFYGRGGMGDEDERSSAEDFAEALGALVNGKTPLSGIVLDLRGNPGGYLEEAVSMAGLFIGNQAVVAVVGQDSHRILRDDKATPLYDGPLVVLVDEDSASASEVLAGALKDHQRAVLVGTPRTYGKGSVQKLFHLGDEFFGAQWAGLPASGVVKLTTSVFYSPLGHSPANGGVGTHISLTREDEPKAPRVEVPDLDPFVDASSLRNIGAKRTALEQKVGEILLSRELKRAAPAFSPGEEAKSLAIEETKEGQLDEAVGITEELAAIEAREAAEEHAAVSRKP